MKTGILSHKHLYLLLVEFPRKKYTVKYSFLKIIKLGDIGSYTTINEASKNQKHSLNEKKIIDRIGTWNRYLGNYF